LEFDAVILIGVDDGRVPPTGKAVTEDSIHYLTYTAHNRLYVAITRARYRVEILGNKTYGPSKLFQNAIANKLIHLH
jgi:superfamily I DNA/RNA helicase